MNRLMVMGEVLKPSDGLWGALKFNDEFLNLLTVFEGW
jgi:hypothetical protein